MKECRRRFLNLAAGSVFLVGEPWKAWAQTYPARPVIISVGLAAGGGTDLVARLVADWLSRRFGQPFIVENRTGMGGNLSTERVLKSAPDGYTLLFAAPNTTIGASLYRKLPFDFRRDAVPVAFVMRFPNVMVVPSSLPVQSVQEFIDYARRYPGKLSYASSGHGTSLHLSGAMFSLMTKIDMIHVPYRGSHAAYPDLIEGRVHVMFDNITIALQMARAGKVRALGVTSAVRWTSAPEIPAIAETVPGFEAMVWYGIVAPRGTPSDVVLTLNKAVTEAFSDPDFLARLADTGGMAMSMTPEQFEKFIDEDIERWRKVVDFAGAWID
ncbi:tripartite-type tricarboxylate transporter receptor subunit TctC [Bradyrhizobium sp. AZCC 2262]|uniref:Bug family tripartite tricarboxylate transporter substrate binding protein n=1 Tax=Bradyrhizobium sp. AZCC 2262 TaxID=3117022 RepID=UPI002FF12DE8